MGATNARNGLTYGALEAASVAAGVVGSADSSGPFADSWSLDGLGGVVNKSRGGDEPCRGCRLSGAASPSASLLLLFRCSVNTEVLRKNFVGCIFRGHGGGSGGRAGPSHLTCRGATAGATARHTDLPGSDRLPVGGPQNPANQAAVTILCSGRRYGSRSTSVPPARSSAFRFPLVCASCPQCPG